MKQIQSMDAGRESRAGKVSRFIFGNDTFISYARREATIYALVLANELTKNELSCFLDQWGTPSGTDLPGELILTLRRSNMLVLLGTEKAAASKAVEIEVKEFKKTGRTIVPVSFDGALEKAEWFEDLIAGISITHESKQTLESGKPSAHVISRIVNAENFTRRNKRLRNYFWMTASSVVAMLLLGALASLFIVRQANAKARDAETRRQNADARAAAAETKRQAAETEASRLSDIAKDAQAQQKMAEDKADKAAENEAAATANAEKQQQVAAEQQKRGRRLTYIGDMQMARQSFESGKIESSEKFLNAFLPENNQDEDLRGYEWYHLWHASHRKLASIWLNDIEVVYINAVAFAPGGKQLVTADSRGLQLWDAADITSPRLLQKLAEGDFRSVSYSPDGSILAANSGNAILLWNAKTRDALNPIVQPEGKEFGSMVFSPAHGSRLAFADESGINIWDIDAGKMSRAVETILLPHNEIALAFSPDGKHLGVELDGIIEIWNLPSGGGEATRIITFEERLLEPTLFLPDNRTVAAIVNGDQFKVWDIETKVVKISFTIDLGAGVFISQPLNITAALSPDGKLLATGSAGGVIYGGGVKLWETSTGQLLDTFDGLGTRGDVATLAFSGDGQALAIGVGQEVQLSDAARTRLSTELPSTESTVRQMAISADGHLLATINSAKNKPSYQQEWEEGEMTTLYFWNTDTGKLEYTHERKGFRAIAFSPDGSKYATLTQQKRTVGEDLTTWNVELWDARTHASLGPPLGKTSQPNLAFSPDGKRLALAPDDYTKYVCRDACIQFWDIATGEKSPLPLNPQPDRHAGFDGDAPEIYSPDGKLLVYESDFQFSDVIGFLDTTTKKTILTFTSDSQLQSTSFAFSPDGRTFAIGYSNSTVSLWNISSLYEENPPSPDDDAWKVGGKNFIAMMEEYTSGISSIAFSPDAKTIAIASYDGEVKLWDAAFYQPLATLKSKVGVITSMLFTPDGKILITSGADGSDGDSSIRLWRAATKEELALQKPLARH